MVRVPGADTAPSTSGLDAPRTWPQRTHFRSSPTCRCRRYAVLSMGRLSNPDRRSVPAPPGRVLLSSSDARFWTVRMEKTNRPVVLHTSSEASLSLDHSSLQTDVPSQSYGEFSERLRSVSLRERSCCRGAIMWGRNLQAWSPSRRRHHSPDCSHWRAHLPAGRLGPRGRSQVADR
jgi:hypothetical protein